jgi:hypothetical protein
MSGAHYALGGLLLFVALNAFGGGYYGLSGAPGVPTAWLDGSPFKDYFVPSLVLLVSVGGSCLIAAVAVFAGFQVSRAGALIAGSIVIGWIVVQVGVIGYVSWMQPATAAVGSMILALAWRLRLER